MGKITTKDGTEIFYKDWEIGAPGSGCSFITAGRSAPMTGIPR
jgi:hypothetical protein